MKRFAGALIVFTAICLTFIADGFSQAKPDSLLRLTHTVSLPGYTGDFDHFSEDLAGGRLFLAAEDHGTVEVFDLKSGSHLKTLTGFEVPHSLMMLPKQNRILVVDGGKGLSKLISADNYKEIAKVKTTPGADSIGYDASANELFVVTGGKDVDMDKSFLEVIEPASGRHLGSIEFQSRHVEAMAVEQSGPRLYVNITDQGKIAVVDKAKRAVIATWPVAPCGENSPMAMDEANKRLFVVCRKPAMLAVFDTTTGKIITTMPAPARSDGVSFDSVHRRIYVPGGEGYIGVYQQKDANTYALVARVPSATGAKTCLWVPERNRLFVAVSPGDTKAEAKVLTFEAGE